MTGPFKAATSRVILRNIDMRILLSPTPFMGICALHCLGYFGFGGNIACESQELGSWACRRVLEIRVSESVSPVSPSPCRQPCPLLSPWLSSYAGRTRPLCRDVCCMLASFYFCLACSCKARGPASGGTDTAFRRRGPRRVPRPHGCTSTLQEDPSCSSDGLGFHIRTYG